MKLLTDKKNKNRERERDLEEFKQVFFFINNDLSNQVSRNSITNSDILLSHIGIIISSILLKLYYIVLLTICN